jgi:hypothetical protein
MDKDQEGWQFIKTQRAHQSMFPDVPRCADKESV